MCQVPGAQLWIGEEATCPKLPRLALGQKPQQQEGRDLPIGPFLCLNRQNLGQAPEPDAPGQPGFENGIHGQAS